MVILLPLLLEVAFISTLAYLLNHAEEEFERRLESKQIVIAATGVVEHLIDAEMITMMYNAHPMPFLGMRFDEDKIKIESSLAELKALAASSPSREKKSSVIINSVENTLKRLTRIFTQERDMSMKRVMDSDEAGRRTYKAFTAAFEDIDKLLDEEQKTQEQVAIKEKQYRRGIEQALNWGLTSTVALTIGLAIVFTTGITRRLKVVLENTRRLRDREPLNPPIKGNDEISQLDEVFHASARDLESVDRQRRQLVALVREELGEPLKQVQFVLHNLSQGVLGELSPRAQNRLGMAALDTDRVTRLIDDLLSIEGMRGAQFELALERVSSADLVAGALASIRDMAERSNVKLETVGKEVEFVADRQRMIQVLINLLSNAIKFSSAGEKVTVSVLLEEQAIELRVADTGRGIPKDKIDEIFEPFKQVDEADQLTRGGSGLGLPICKTIVAQHGGSIAVVSVEGKGSTFSVRLPLNRNNQV
ncbi:MAG: HAMP domain-containing histidine kinase [Cyanobacteria bacterium]|nr:HAMP domain-containing histidine kinase [Cyanobacteriota bacterium]